MLEKWRRDHPERPIREFWDDYYRHQRTRWVKELREFGLDPRFTFDEAYAATNLDPFSPPQEPTKEEP